MKNEMLRSADDDAGFSMIELLVVVSVIFILSLISLFYLTGSQKAYKPDDQALLITDMLQEARQRSLTQVETMRVEINESTNSVRLIDENEIDTADDDVVLRELALFNPAEVKFRQRPSNIPGATNPPEMFPVDDCDWEGSQHPTSISQTVCTMRFMSNGTVVDAGNDEIGTGAVPTGATVHMWAPKTTAQTTSDIARAITVVGSSGTVRLWEWNPSISDTNKWQDSRRSGTYGGAATPTPSPTP
jgi:prepilin-type N-terminal cleavage/methylation domain-containing protein